MAARQQSCEGVEKNSFQPVEPQTQWEQAFIAGLSNDDGRAALSHLKAGRPVYISDPEYPDQIIRLYPGGQREIVTIDEQSQFHVVLALG